MSTFLVKQHTVRTHMCLLSGCVYYAILLHSKNVIAILLFVYHFNLIMFAIFNTSKTPSDTKQET